jgi:hypothetical protein
MTPEDPAIETVRVARRQISRSVDHDPKRLVEYYLRLQERHRDRIVSVGREGDSDTRPGTATP